MTAELDTTRVVRAWLEEGATRLPDHVLDAVLADIPTTAQRRRISAVDGAFRRARWARLLVALMMLALVGASLALATGAWRVAPIPRPFEVRPLDIGRYVIDDPFPVRISLDVPDGWEGVDLGNDTAAIALSAGGDAGAALTFTLVEGVYPDPCHWAESSLVRVGPIVDDLAAALAGTRGVFVTGPVATDFGGYAAQHVTLDAPKSFTGCTNLDDPFHLWGIPQTHSLMPGEHDQIWISQVGSTRLVAYSEVYPTTPRAVVEELGRIVASIRLERFAAIAETSPTPPPTEIPS